MRQSTFVLAFAIVFPVGAQWRTNPLNNVTGIWPTGNGVFQQSSSLQKSAIDSGLTFSRVNVTTPALLTDNRYLAFSGTTLYMASRQGGVWVCDAACLSANDGTKGWWLVDGLTELRVNGLCINDIGEPILGSSLGHVYRLKTGNRYWTPIADTSSFSASAFFGCVVNSNNTVIASDSGGKIFKSTDHGENWTLVINIAGGGPPWVNPADHNEIMVGGENDIIYRTTNGGESSGDWLNIAPGQNGYTSTDGFAGHDTQFFAKDNSGNIVANGTIYDKSVAYITIASSTNWLVPSHPHGGMAISTHGIKAASGDIYWAGRIDGIMRTTDIASSGITLTNVQNGLPGSINGDGFALVKAPDGKLYLGYTSGGGLWRTTVSIDSLSSGASVTWEQFNGPYWSQATSLIDTGSSVLYAAFPGNGVGKSTDGGDTWSVSHSGMTSYQLNDVAKSTVTGNIYACADNVPRQLIPWGGGIFKSTNAGSTWAQSVNGWGTSVTGGTAANCISVAIPSTGEIVAAGTDGIYQSTDSAANWTKKNSGTTYTKCRVRSSDDAIVCLSTNGTPTKSTDKGATWANCGAVSGPSNFYDITYDSSGNIYLATDAGIKTSTNSCTSWSAAFSGTFSGSSVIGSIAFSGSSTVYVGTQNVLFTSSGAGAGLFYRSLDSGTTFTNTFPYPVNATLLENFTTDRDNGETPTPRKLWSAYLGDDQRNTFTVDTTNKWGRSTSAPASYWTNASSTQISVVVSSNTATATFSSAHGLTNGINFWITGATGDTDLNATWVIASVPTTTTITFTTTNVSNGTYANSAIEAGSCFVNSAPTQYCAWYTNMLPQKPSYNWNGAGTSASSGYAQTWIKEGTFDSASNRLSFKMKCDKDIPRVAFNTGVGTMSFGNYIRNQNNAGGTSFQGQHYYWLSNMPLTAGRWGKIVLKAAPQQLVGDPQGGQANFPADPELGTNNTENVATMNGLTRWYWDVDPPTAAFQGSNCDITTIEFWKSVPEPVVYVQVDNLSYDGSAYNLVFYTDKNSTTTYDVKWSRQPMHLWGFSSGTTVSGSPFTASGSAYSAGPTVSLTSSELDTIYFAMRPNMPVKGATNATPIVITLDGTTNLPDCSAYTIASVGGNTNANGARFLKLLATNYNTNTTSLSSVTYQLYSDAACSTAVAGNGSYTSGGTVTGASDTEGFVEVFRYTDAAAAVNTGGAVVSGKTTMSGKTTH